MFDWSLFTKITGLALVDAINVCAFAVLIALLVNILARNIDKPKKVLTTGLSFISAIFLTYLLYAYILIQFFSTLTTTIKGFSTYFYTIFAIIAMSIGALNIKDFFSYRRGGIAREMPLSMRPKVQNLIQKVTSPGGAFVIGIFVTLFLLTCTVWPLFVAAGLLTDRGFISALPWFAYYNFLFVLPMIVITMAVYAGSTTIKNVEYWKKKNTKLMHLIGGIILFAVGLALLMGWV